MRELVEHDRHYVVNYGPQASKNTYYNPFLAKDYAVNIYDVNVPDGIAYINYQGNRYDIGYASYINNGFQITIYNQIDNPEIAHALVYGATYVFTPDTEQIFSTGKGGYSFNYKYKEKLEESHIDLSPASPEYHVVLDSGLPIGRVYAAHPTGNTSNIVSGELLLNIPLNSDNYIYNQMFNGIKFNTSDLSVHVNGDLRMTYLGHNKFKFEKHIVKTNFI